MKRKGAPAKEGKCPRDAPKDQKCDNCRLRKGACQFAARIAAANATLSPGEPSTSERSRPQAAADSDMDDAEPRPSRERKAPERWQCDANITSRATGTRRPDSCCSCSEPTTSDESAAPKPKFTGPMDKYLSDKRVEAAVNRAVKSITDNPADLERELRAFAETSEGWRQKSMTLQQENDAIQKKLDKVTKELEKVKKEAAREIGNFSDAEDHKAILKAIVGKGYANDESGRHLLRKHAAAIVEKIQEKAKGDLLGQMQLAEAVKRRLSPANFEPDKDLYVALAIAESIRAWMKELKSKYHGRFPNDVRAAYRAVHQAVATSCSNPTGWSCADIGHATSVGTITMTKLAATASTSTLHAARKRHTAGLPRSVP